MGADVTKKLEIIISSKADLSNMQKVKKILIESKDRLKELGDKYKSATGSMGGFASTASKLREKLAILQKAFDKQARKLLVVRTNLKHANREIRNLGGSTDKTTKKTKRHRQEIDKLGRSYKKTQKAARGYDNTHGNIRGHTEGLRRAIGALRNQILLFVFALRAVINVITSSVAASNQLEASMVGLRAVTEKTGTSFHDAQLFMEEFTEKGLISVADTAAGLKNLLAAGFGMPDAIKLMRTLGDAAAFNRQGTLEYGAAIVGATQGIKNQNSIMTDNAGITKNLNIMYKEYAATLGKGAGSLSEVEKNQAILNGFMKEGALFTGNMAKLTDTYMGKTQKLSQSIFKAKAAFGDLIKSGLKPFVAEIEKVISVVADWIAQNEILIKSEIKVFLEALTTSLKVTWDVLVGVNDALKIFGASIKDVVVFFALFKGSSFVMAKFGVLITGIKGLMKLAFGLQTLKAIKNVTKLHTVIFKAGRAFRLAGAIGVTGFSKALIAARVALTALTGPIGIVIGLITLAAGAYAYFTLKNKQSAKVSMETTAAQKQQARELIKSSFDLSQSMIAKYTQQLKSKDLTVEEIEVLKEKLSIEEKLFVFSRRAEAVEQARERLKPEGRDTASSFALAFKKVEDARFKSKKDLEGMLETTEARVEAEKKLVIGYEEETRALEQQNRIDSQRFSTAVGMGNLSDEQLNKFTAQRKVQKKAGEDDLDERKRWLADQNESLSTHQAILLALRMMLGIEEDIVDKVDLEKEKRSAALKSLLKLIAKLKGDIAALGMGAVAKKLVDFGTKIEILRLRLEEFKETLKKAGEVKEFEGLIEQFDRLGRGAILSDQIKAINNELTKLGQSPIEQKLAGINTKIAMMNFQWSQARGILMIQGRLTKENIELLRLWAEAIDKIAIALKDRLFDDTVKKWADQSEASIRSLSNSFVDLASDRVQGPFAGGLFGAGEKGEVNRLKTQIDHTQRLMDLQKQFEDREKDINEAAGTDPEKQVQAAIEIAKAREDLERQMTMSAAIAAEERIAIVANEWTTRLDMMEQFAGGWQSLGGVLADVWITQSNEMEAQIERQRSLFDRGKIDQKQFEDRKLQIERAAQLDREQAAAKFGANMLRQAGQIAQAYLMQAAVAQFATATATSASSTMWAAHFTAQAAALGVAAAGAMAIPGAGPFLSKMYTAAATAMVAASTISGAAAVGSVGAGIALAGAGIAVGVGTGLAAGAIEANNLGGEGGFLGTPTEDVFADRNKRLGGSIRAQEVHLSINPVTYIQAEGDIFIGEGITVETFKGLVNEAFVNRAQDALETGEIQIDELVNIKG